MKTKKVSFLKRYDDGEFETEYFYIAEEQEEFSFILRRALLGKYVRSNFPEKNYTITVVDVVEDKDHPNK